MTNISVDEIQSRVASLVDQNEATSSISAADYSLRLKYINMALTEWGEIYDWDTLYKEYNVLVSTSSGNASVALPTDFRKLASFPAITWTGTTTDKFPQVNPQEDGQFSDTDKRVWILGNPRAAYTMRVFGVTLISGASVKVPYYASPQSLVSPANVADIPNPDFLVQRTIGYLWQGREDPRFPQAIADADRILSNMIEHENVFGRAAYHDSVRTVEQTRASFRWGKDS